MKTKARFEGTTPGRRDSGKALLYAIALIGGFAAALLVLATPAGAPLRHALGLHEGAPAGAMEEAPGDAEQQYWTCGMHPQVIETSPGNCPICGMKLVPLRGGASAGKTTGAGPAGAGSKERRVLFYRNPMDPTVTSPVPMKDSMGMDYVPVYEEDGSAGSDEAGLVRINPAVVQNMGVRTERVRRGDVKRRIRTVGYLDYDQEKMVTVTTKYPGFVEKVYINYIGQPVRAGEPLFEVYSPELVQTEQELLSALEFAEKMKDTPEEVSRRAAGLVDAARTRLSYWDITPEQVASLERSRKVFRTLTVTAPVGGVVMKRMNALEGMSVRPGMDVMHIANLSSLWLNVEVFDDQLAWLKEGSEASITLTYFPGESFKGKVRYVEPEVSEATRTIKLTLEVPNRDGRLVSGMYATVEFAPVVRANALVVPSQAVIRSGTRNIVVLALGDGRFLPKDVHLGPEGEGWVQVLDGIKDGDEVVTSSQFLIDSESSLREAVQKLVSAHEQG